MCNHCPFVKYVIDELVELIKTKTQSDRRDILTDYLLFGFAYESDVPIQFDFYSKLFDFHLKELQNLKEDL